MIYVRHVQQPSSISVSLATSVRGFSASSENQTVSQEVMNFLTLLAL